MRITKTHGRSYVKKFEGKKKPKRVLWLNKKAHKTSPSDDVEQEFTVEFPEFTKSNPKIVIAQWISVIDKIYRKPKATQKPSKATRDARENLGTECWKIIKDENLLKTDGDDTDYEKIWQWKLHPYDKGNDQNRNSLAKGRLFKTFDDVLLAINPPEEKYNFALAHAIKLHLYKGRFKTETKNSGQESCGFIEHRANSIEKNTLAGNFLKVFSQPGEISEEKINEAYFGDVSWTTEDEKFFSTEADDLAQQILDLCDTCFAKHRDKNGKEIKKKRRPYTTEYISLINEHFKKVLKPTVEKNVMQTLREDAENGERNQRVMLLYTQIREFYKKVFRSHYKKNIDLLLPASNAELFIKLRQPSRNKSINNLVRLGKVLHYEGHVRGEPKKEKENGVKPTTGSNEIWTIPPHELAMSNYFSSEGQAQIKSTEAFLRIWRSCVSLANRSLHNFIDTEGTLDLSDQEGRTDVLGGQASLIRVLNMPEDDETLYNLPAKLQLQFGKSADFFKGFDNRYIIAVLLDYTLSVRHNTFHFGNRKSFSKTLESLSGEFSRTDVLKGLDAANREEFAKQYIEIGKKVEELVKEDKRDFAMRIYNAAIGVKLDYYLNKEQLENYIDLVSLDLKEVKADFGLPKFSKLLVRHDNISGHRKGLIKPIAFIPEPVNRDRLEEFPALRARFVATKSVYEGPFKEWLAKNSHDKINKYSKKAIQRTSDAAKSMNGKDDKLAALIEAQASNLPELTKGESFIDLISHLTAATASEMRVQKAYESDGSSAKNQAEWINNYKIDLVMLLLQEYCEHEKRKSILEPINQLNQNTRPSELASSYDISQLVPSEHDEWKDWAARLYMFLHFVPVDEANLLYQQFLKWGALQTEGKNDEEVNTIKEVFLLYSKMHDDKFSGNLTNEGQTDQRVAFDYSQYSFIFEDDYTLQHMLRISGLDQTAQSYIINPDTDTQLVAVTRGLREISRFGYLQFIKKIHSDALKSGRISKTTQQEINQLRDDEHLLEVENAHKSIEKFSKKKSTGGKWNAEEVKEYKSAVQLIHEHRALSDKVTLTDIVKLHKMLTEFFGRMVDFSAQWERDHYFILLAIVWLLTKTSKNGAKKPNDYIEKKCAFYYARVPKKKEIEDEDLQNQLIKLGLQDLDGMHLVRNQYAHFSFLDDRSGQEKDCDFTRLITDLRELRSYDRKLKNSVTKSIKDLICREGFNIDWEINKDHELSFKSLNSDVIAHLKTIKTFNNAKETFYEEKHTERMTNFMHAALSQKVFTCPRG